MTAEGRFLIRTWRDATKRRECNQPGVKHEPPGLVVPLAEHCPPIHERGDDYNGGMRGRYRRVARLEALAA